MVHERQKLSQAEGAHARRRWHTRGGGAGKVGCTSVGAATPFAAAGIFFLDNSSFGGPGTCTILGLRVLVYQVTVVWRFHVLALQQC